MDNYMSLPLEWFVAALLGCRRPAFMFPICSPNAVQAINPTLLRKWFPSTIRGDDLKFKKAIARIDGHSVPMLEGVYLVSTPEEDAKMGKLFVEVMLDGPVGPLIATDTAASSFQDVLGRFGIAMEVSDPDGREEDVAMPPTPPKAWASSSSSDSSSGSSSSSSDSSSDSKPSSKKARAA
jgi:hypothetical protein